MGQVGQGVVAHQRMSLGVEGLRLPLEGAAQRRFKLEAARLQSCQSLDSAGCSAGGSGRSGELNRISPRGVCSTAQMPGEPLLT